MTKLWFISAPLYSHTDWGGFLKTAQALHRGGHDLTWISGERLKNSVQRAGLPFQPIVETGWLWPPPPTPDFSAMSPNEATRLRFLRALDTWLSTDIVGTAAQELIDLADDLGKPDIIVTDPFLSAAALAAEALDRPLVVAGWPAQGNLVKERLAPIQRNLGQEGLDRINQLCQQLSLTGTNFSDGPTPSIVSPHLHLCYFTENWYIFEASTLLEQNIYVGGAATSPKTDPPHWLTAIPDQTPLAVITQGSTFSGDLSFYGQAAQAAAQAGLLPLVAIGWHPMAPEDKEQLIAALPPGTRLLNWIPFDHVLPRTRLMIHHGGMGTTHYAVVHGIPQIVVPHAADQRVQAKRVAVAKVGLHLTTHDIRQGQLAEGAVALVNNAKVKQTARNLAEEMASLGGPEQAAEAILKLK